MKNPRSVYLIDTENVTSEWIGKVKILTPNDKVVMFCGPSSAGIPFYRMEEFLKDYPTRQIECFSTSPGHNAMDFHICAKLGMMLAKAPNSNYYIISKDTGYDPLVSTLRHQGFHAYRVTCAELDHIYLKRLLAQQREEQEVKEKKEEKALTQEQRKPDKFGLVGIGVRDTQSDKTPKLIVNKAKPANPVTSLPKPKSTINTLDNEKTAQKEPAIPSQFSPQPTVEPVKEIVQPDLQAVIAPVKIVMPTKDHPIVENPIKEQPELKIQHIIMDFLKREGVEGDNADKICTAIQKAKKPYKKNIVSASSETIFRTVGKGNKDSAKRAKELLQTVKTELAPELDSAF